MSVSDEIKQRIDIVDLVSRYTPLRKAGSTYKGLCPFHSERTPSFVVFPHSGTWRCFGACGEGGDIFAFVMRKENLDFREALQLLAKEAGVDLDNNPADPQRTRRAGIYEANAAAADYFRHILLTHPAAAQARAYLQRRGIDHAVIDQFQLGYSLEQWSSLRDHLLAQKYDLELLVDAGLVKRHEERNSTYDAFRNRVMIPIRDRLGRVIGFGGRVLDGSQPKYLNTADTDLFHKSHIVYGLDMAHQAIRTQDCVVIVEGYMDVIAAHQFGFTNVVACMGTALTAEQLQQLQRYTNNFVLALDADAAGQQATIRGLNQARQALSRVRKPTVTPGGVRMTERLAATLYIAAMPTGRDPDDVIRQDPQTWQNLIAQAKPLVDFYFATVTQETDLADARGKGLAVAELAPLIAELEDEVEREHYIQRLARLVQLDERTIAGRVQAAARTGQAAGQRTQNTSRNVAARSGAARRYDRGDAPVVPQPPPRDDPATPALSPTVQTEDYLLALLLRDPDLLIWLTSAAALREIAPLEAADWLHVENQEIFRALKYFMSSDIPWDVELFQESLPPPLHGRLAHLIAVGAALPTYNGDDVREDLLKVLVRLRLDHLKMRSLQVRFLMDEVADNRERDDARDLFTLSNQVLRDLSYLQTKYHELSRVLAGRRRGELGVKIR